MTRRRTPAGDAGDADELGVVDDWIGRLKRTAQEEVG
jgi:hypothetical protein